VVLGVIGPDDNQFSERFVTTLFADITDPSEILNLLTVPGPLPPVMADLQFGLTLDVKHTFTDRTKGQQWRVRTLIQVPLLRDVSDDPIRPTIPIEAFVVDEAVDAAPPDVLCLDQFDGGSEIRLEPACDADLLLTCNGYDHLWSAANPAQRSELLLLLEDPEASMGSLSTRQIFTGERVLTGPLRDSVREVGVELTRLLRGQD
jgi:hypothetical protein